MLPGSEPLPSRRRCTPKLNGVVENEGRHSHQTRVLAICDGTACPQASVTAHSMLGIVIVLLIIVLLSSPVP